MLKPTIPFLGLFFISAGLSLWFSLAEKSVTSSSAKWIEIPKASVAAISLQTKKEKIDIRKQEGLFWATISKRGGESESAGYTFRVNKEFSKVLSGLDPLYAKRIVGNTKDVKLLDFGLGDESTRIKISHSDAQVREMVMGKRSYGSSSLYLQDLKTGTIALVESEVFELLKSSRSRLIERNIWDSQVHSEMTKGTIIYEGKEVSFNSELGPKKKWEASKDSIDDKLLNNWLSQLNKLRVQDYPDLKTTESLKKLKGLFFCKV